MKKTISGVSGMRDEIKAMEGTQEAIALARQFHETYERLAPQFGYETREDTRAFDPESANGRLMTAVCWQVMQDPVIACREALEYWFERSTCLCGARHDSLESHPHVGGCPIGDALGEI